MNGNPDRHIRALIRDHGPMDVGTFMNIAIGHYYATRDPFGAAGDFTTAPEISQMFGELLGAWAADTWMKLGCPSPFMLIECGPGRGTLMADALRATRKVPGFHEAMEVHLIETSPVLKKKQGELLGAYDPQWHDALTADKPFILIANEFLDALPIRQYQFSRGQWHERVLGLDENNDFVFGLSPSPASRRSTPSPHRGEGRGEGAVFEMSPARESFVENLCDLLKQHTGAALFIDYGHDVSACGDTLQAVKSHQFVPVLSDIGEADLTSHVDFAALKRAAQGKDAAVHGPAAQGAFLERLGIRERAAALSRPATVEQRESIMAALGRLTGPSHMGRLFRVMGLCHDENISLSGF